MASAATRLGIELMMQWVEGPAEYGSAFAAMKNEGAAGAVVAASQPLASHAREVAARASENGLPTICEWDYMARVGEYVARILKGALPAELLTSGSSPSTEVSRSD